MFFCRNRQCLQESSIFEMRVVNVFVNRFFSMKWGIFEKMRLFFCFFILSDNRVTNEKGTISLLTQSVIQTTVGRKNLGNIH